MLDIVRQVASYEFANKICAATKEWSCLWVILNCVCHHFGVWWRSINCQLWCGITGVHLIKCFDNNLIVKFPVTEKRVVKCKPYTSIVELYSVCRMPYWRTEEIGRMAECESCKRWFHRKSEKIAAAVFSDGKQWFCLTCR